MMVGVLVVVSAARDGDDLGLDGCWALVLMVAVSAGLAGVPAVTELLRGRQANRHRC